MWSWDDWKQSFYAWEKPTAELLEIWMKSPLILEPAGAMLTAATRLKASGDRAMATWWGSLGLPTKRDQERALHALNELQSKVLDLEERLADLE